MGANLKTLLALLRENGPGRYPLHLLIIWATAIARLPFSTYERWQVARSPHLESKPPIFIIGHWRSGTTFLHSVLSQAPQFAYTSPLAVGLPWDFLTLGNALRPILEGALPKDRFIDRVPVNPDSPQEDEIALASMQLLSFYQGLYFPKQFSKHFNAGIFFEGCSDLEIETWQQAMVLFCKKLQLQNPDQQLLIKNPVYTARVQKLRELWPAAKFIHIYRNPYIVYRSTLNFYDKLFRELSLQAFDQVPVEEIILESYPKMIETAQRETSALPTQDFVELRFETFEANPVEQLEKIYAQLELTGWKEDLPYFQRYLESQKHYRKNEYTFPKEMTERVRDRWQPLLEQWGYEPPI
nr:sulfotransferase [cf. Phormidesmis sp. LEGE 11477]